MGSATRQAKPARGMAQYQDYGIRRIDEVFAEHIGDRPERIELSEAELREVIDACNEVIEPFGKTVSDRRWVAYLDPLWNQSSRHLVDRAALKGVCVLQNIAFVCDDLRVSHGLDAVLPRLRLMCERYYQGEDVWWAYEGARSWMVSDQMFREHPARELLCGDLDRYWRFRVVDGGVDWWMKMSYPIFRDPAFTEHAKTGLAARLATRGLMAVNDFFSYDREKGNGEINNCFLLCDVDYEEEFYPFFEARMDEIIDDIRCIKAFDQVTREILLDLIYGTFLWECASERYADAVSPLNEPLDWRVREWQRQ